MVQTGAAIELSTKQQAVSSNKKLVGKATRKQASNKKLKDTQKSVGQLKSKNKNSGRKVGGNAKDKGKKQPPVKSRNVRGVGKKGKLQQVENEKPSKPKAKPKTESLQIPKKIMRKARQESTLCRKKKEDDPEWEGYSDDEGSVASAILDEDICYGCGLPTLYDDDWTSLVLCDKCDGEYHLKCAGLERVPRISFTCPKCVKETLEFTQQKFTVDGSTFKIPKRKKGMKPQVCYSPGRPLDVAMRECEEKGLMVASNVFPHETMRLLTHGTAEKKTSSGRVAATWTGITHEIVTRFKQGGHNIVDRGGRFDLKIPDFVVKELGIEQLLEPILTRLRGIMSHTPPPELRTHNIVFVPVGSPAQDWHCDDSFYKGKQHRYFTIMVHLNPIDSLCGGTEIWSTDLKSEDLIRARPGDAFVFSGSLLHRGQANEGFTHRFFYYASFACRADANSDN